MAAKVLYILAVIAIVVKADNDCDCDPKPTEDKALWNFLSKLSDGYDESDTEDKEMRAVLPGVLSPLLECNCLDKNRKKRKIMPEENSEVAAENGALVREKKYIHLKTKRCPKGHVWIGIMCAPQEILE